MVEVMSSIKCPKRVDFLATHGSMRVPATDRELSGYEVRDSLFSPPLVLVVAASPGNGDCVG